MRTLVEHSGELVERAVLMKTVWPDLVVEDNNLDQQVSLVRHALGERRGRHRYIVTVPGRGYRFAVPVTLAQSGAPVATTEPAIPPSTATRGEPGVGAPPRARPWLWPAALAVATFALVAGSLAVLLDWGGRSGAVQSFARADNSGRAAFQADDSVGQQPIA